MNNKNNALITISHVTVSYDSLLVLHDICTTITAGQMVGIVGPNGGGKSTLIKAIVGLLNPIAGTITVSMQHKGPLYAYVPQRSAIDWDFPLSVTDVVMMGRLPHQPFYAWASEYDHVVVKESLAAVNLLSYAHTPIGDLSGGQQQRVFIARALAQDAPIYVLDEPFNNVDAVTERIIIDVLRKLVARGKTVLMVHHNMYTAQHYFDYLIYIHKTVRAQGPTTQVYPVIMDLLKESA